MASKRLKSMVAREAVNFNKNALKLDTIAFASPPVRAKVLREANMSLVKALSTATRLLKEQGYEFRQGHANRARRLASRSVKLANKKILVSGLPGHVSRGGHFFKDVASKSRQLVHPEAWKNNKQLGAGFFDDLKHGFEKFGSDVKHAAYKAGDGIKHAAYVTGDTVKHVAYEAAPVLKEAAEETGKEIAKQAPKAIAQAAITAALA